MRRIRASARCWPTSIVPEYVSHGDAAKARRNHRLASWTSTSRTSSRASQLCVRSSKPCTATIPIGPLRTRVSTCRRWRRRRSRVVHHRAGMAYLSARRSNEAQKHALQGFWLADSDGERRLAARAASVLYAVNYHLTGDMHSARYYAELAAVEATAAGEKAIRRLFLCVQLDFAVSFGEWDRAGSLVDLLRREKLVRRLFRSAQTAQVAIVVLAGTFGRLYVDERRGRYVSRVGE